MKKILLGFLIGLGLIASVALANTIIHSQNTVVEEAVEDFGGSYATQPITLVGISPTSTSISTYNTETLSTTTPTTTDFIHFGPEIDIVDMFLIVEATSTDNYTLNWDITTSPLDSSNATSTVNFYAFDASSSSSGTITHTTASSTNTWTLPGLGRYNRRVTVCSNNYDGTDDIPSCNAGWYKFEFGRRDYSGIELQADVVGKSN
jgi:hypothetical protein